MKGLGTDDSTLTRVIVTRTEIDMQYIKAEYRKKYGKSLNDAVHSETSGNYRTFLLALLGPNH
jgi:annexin D